MDSKEPQLDKIEMELPVNVPKKKKHIGLIIIHIFALLLFIVACLLAAYYWNENNKAQKEIITFGKTIQTQTKTIKALQLSAAAVTTATTTVPAANTATTSAATTTTTTVAPTATAISNIKLSVSSGNTQALEGYMATTVNVILAATEAYGPQTASQAVSEVTTFIGNSMTTTWDFALGASILSSYGQGGYSQYFPNTAIVGKSNDNKVISFSFDTNGKVSTIFMAANENLLQ